ncbi:MAG: HlyD family efflux transporter periplasmic adaptor subunit [Bacillota bacterium]|nr:hypothetical protein [Candidatus Fermentithermobacillaceae bacterium]
MTRRYRSKAKLRSYARRITFLAILLSIVLLLTWPYLRSAFLRATISIGRGTLGSLEERIGGEAVFAGGVSLVTSPAPGTLRLLVKDGESVRTGQVIAEVGKVGAKEAFDDSLRFAKSRLASYETETREEFERLSASVESSYAEAVGLLFMSQDAAAKGAVTLSREYETRLENEEKRLRHDADRLAQIEGERARLAANVAAIEAAQASSVVSVISPASGVFSTEVTSIEAKFSKDAIAGKNAAEIAILAREAREAQSGSIKDGQSVQVGDILGRIISGHAVSFYLPIKTEDKPDVKKGGTVELALLSGASVQARIADVVDGKPPGYSIIVGDISVMPVQSVTKAGQIGIIVKTQSGVVIPRSALIDRDGRQGVLLVQKTYARFREVQVLMVKGDQAVVKGIEETDEILLRAWGFLEGRRVR